MPSPDPSPISKKKAASLPVLIKPPTKARSRPKGRRTAWLFGKPVPVRPYRPPNRSEDISSARILKSTGNERTTTPLSVIARPLSGVSKNGAADMRHIPMLLCPLPSNTFSHTFRRPRIGTLPSYVFFYVSPLV